MQYLKDYLKFLYWFIGYYYHLNLSDKKRREWYIKQYKHFEKTFGGSLFIGDYERDWQYICLNGKIELCFMYYPVSIVNIESRDVFKIDKVFIINEEEFEIADGNVRLCRDLPKLFKDKYLLADVNYDSNDRVLHYLKYINDGILGHPANIQKVIKDAIKRIFYKKTVFPYCFDGKMITYYRKKDYV